MSLPQFIGTMYNIYKVRGSNLNHHKKKLIYIYLQFSSTCINKHMDIQGAGWLNYLKLSVEKIGETE